MRESGWIKYTWERGGKLRGEEGGGGGDITETQQEVRDWDEVHDIMLKTGLGLFVPNRRSRGFSEAYSTSQGFSICRPCCP